MLNPRILIKLWDFPYNGKVLTLEKIKLLIDYIHLLFSFLQKIRTHVNRKNFVFYKNIEIRNIQTNER